MARITNGGGRDLVHRVRQDINKRYGIKPPAKVEVELFTIAELISAIEDLCLAVEKYVDANDYLKSIARSEED